MKDIPDDYEFQPNEERCKYCKKNYLLECLTLPFLSMQRQSIDHDKKIVTVKCDTFKYK